eukprot:g9314.t1
MQSHVQGARLLLSVPAVVLALIVAPLCQGDLDRDREILSLLYNTTGGPNWFDKEGWGGNDLSLWEGVTVNETSSSVTRLELFRNNLRGEIPAELANLTDCYLLDLSGNYLTGSIPPELGDMEALEQLSLEENLLNGSIPVELAKPNNILKMWLYDNDLEGEIPEEFGDTEMSVIHFGGNKLTGEIPASLGNLFDLQYLILNDNLLAGSIPEEIGQLVVRGSLNAALLLQNNYLTGTVPDDIPDSIPDEDLTVYMFHVDLSGNMLDNWPDQRDESATAPPQTSSTTSSTASSTADRSNSDATAPPQASSTAPPTASSTATRPTSDAEASSPSSLSSPQTQPPSPSPAASEGAGADYSSPTSSPSGTTTAIAAIAGGVAGCAAVLAGVLIFCLLRRKSKESLKTRGDGSGSGGNKKDGRPALSAPGKVFLSLGGGGGGGGNGASSNIMDEESASYSWTRENSDMNFHDSIKKLNAGGGGGGALATAASSTARSPPTAPSTRLLTVDASARLRAPVLLPSLDDRSDDPTTATATSAGAAAGTGKGSSSMVGPATPTSVVEGVGDLIAAALAAAEALTQESFVPGVREAASVVAGLVRLASDHKTNARDAEKRARWCRSIVHTLERAGEVLGKAERKDGEAARVLLDDVQDSIQDMVQIMQSYRSKNTLSRIFVSSLFKKRQEEAEDGINACIQRLQLGLQVSLGNKLESVEEAVQEGLELQRRATVESGALRRRHRRQQRLDQLEIPVSELDITDEVLGRGGFGTVYLADLGGLNAAAKVIVFEDDGVDDDDDDHDDSADADSDGTAAVTADGGGGRYPSKPESAEASAVAAGAAAAAAGAERGGARSSHGENGSLSQSHQHRQQRKAFMRELEAMQRLRGPHTVTIYGAVTSLSDRLILVMELLPGGDLRHRLRKAKGPLDEKVLRKIVRDICCGMAFLHAKQTVHGDLKSANVLFDAAGTAKIADFGTSLWTQHTTRLATYTTKPRETVGLSLPWAAPEILNRQVSSFKSDVYSFGVVLWEILARKIPWKGVAGVDKLVLAVNAGERPVVPEDAPRDLAALTRACWAHHPAARPSFNKTLTELNVNAREKSSTTATTNAATTTTGNGAGNNSRRGGGHHGGGGDGREDSISMLLAAAGVGIFAGRNKQPAASSSSFAHGPTSRGAKERVREALSRNNSSSSSSGSYASRSGRLDRSGPISGVGVGVGPVGGSSRSIGGGGFGRKSSGGGSNALEVLSSSSSVSSPGDAAASSGADLDADGDAGAAVASAATTSSSSAAAAAATENPEESGQHISTMSTAELTLNFDSSASADTENLLSSAFSSGGGVNVSRSAKTKGDAMWLQRRQEHDRQAELESGGRPPPPPYRLLLPNSSRHGGSPKGLSATLGPAPAEPVGASSVAEAPAAGAAITSSAREME